MNPLAVMLSLALLASVNASVNTEVGNDYVCSGQNDDCDCGQARTCTCNLVTGDCLAEQVTDTVQCTLTTGDCKVGAAKTAICEITSGNCLASRVTESASCTMVTGDCEVGGSGSSSCTIQTGDCNANSVTGTLSSITTSGDTYAEKATEVTCVTTSGNCYAKQATSFTCSTTSGTCGAGPDNSGGAVSCAIQGSGDCLCGSADTCVGAIKSGSLNCQSSSQCDCSGVTTGGDCCSKQGTEVTGGTSTSSSSDGLCTATTPYAWPGSGGTSGGGSPGGTSGGGSNGAGTCLCSCTPNGGSEFEETMQNVKESDCTVDECNAHIGQDKCPTFGSMVGALYKAAASSSSGSSGGGSAGAGTCSCSCTPNGGSEFEETMQNVKESDCTPDGCTAKFGENKCPSTNSQRQAQYTASVSSSASTVTVGIMGATAAMATAAILGV